jgi:3-methyl-2-oxobutanoate hydroxymethyltransferase
MITAYDYYSAKLIQQSGIDLILIGDSLGMVVKGEKDTLGVTLDEIIYHSKMVRKGADDTFLIADLPFMTFHTSVEKAKINAARLIVEGAANAVKLEGGSPSRIEMIKGIVDCEIPVVGHLGLTPQSIHKLGGYKVQAKSTEQAEQLIEEAKEIEQAGAIMLVLEAVPEQLAKEVTEELNIVTIGIGAGRFTDGQVLVFHDLFNLADIHPKFAKCYADVAEVIREGLKNYKEEVEGNKFPASEHVYFPLTDTE